MSPKSCSNSVLLNDLLNFLHFTEKLKCILRHGWTSTGRQESVAEHSWRVALMVMLCSRSLDHEVCLEKALKMALIHDIAEVIAGDVPYFLARESSSEKLKKNQKEREAIEQIKQMFHEIFGNELSQIWEEYEDNLSYESKFVRAIDKIEAQIQQNEASTNTWIECETKDATEGYIKQFCSFDAFLDKMANVVIDESKLIVHNSRLSRKASDDLSTSYTTQL